MRDIVAKEFAFAFLVPFLDASLYFAFDRWEERIE